MLALKSYAHGVTMYALDLSLPHSEMQASCVLGGVRPPSTGWNGAARHSRPRQMEYQGDLHMIDRYIIRLAITICMLCSVIGFAAGAAAADRASPADIIAGKTSSRDIKPIFEQFDENRDQRVDRTEFRIWIVGAYDMLDANKDNALSRAELPSVTAFDFDKADHNNDGRLSAFEFIDSDFMKFVRFDLNNDGFVTYEEVIASRR